MATFERNLQILYLLINNKKISIQELKQILNVSEKTILRAVININTFLKKDGKILIEDNYLLLEGDSEVILKQLYLDQENDVFTTYERQMYILNFLLNNDEKVTLNALAEDIVLPIPTLKKDIGLLNKLLANIDASITLTKKQGLTISNIEKEDIVNILVELIHSQIIIRQNNLIIKDMSLEKIFNAYIYRYLKNHWQIKNFTILYKKLIKEKESKEINISYFELTYLSLLICLWLNHSQNQDLLTEVMTNPKFSINKLLNTLYIPKEQKIFLNNFLETIDSKNILVKEVVDHLDQQMAKLFNLKTTLSEECKNNIKYHLTRVLNSDQILNSTNLITQEQNDIFEGSTKYIENFQEIWTLIKEVISQHLTDFTNKEILTFEIFIYIIVWFDQLVYNYPLVIKTVCTGGMGQSLMLQHYLKTIYQHAEIEAKQYALLTKEDHLNADLIISAIPMENIEHDNFLYISFMMAMNKKETIHKQLTKIIYQKLMKEQK